jgi:hypothetical protein
MILRTILVAAIAAVVVTAEVPSTDETTGYSSDENLSWAVTSQKLKEPFMQTMYDDFMKGCRQESIKLNYDPSHYCDFDGKVHFDFQTCAHFDGRTEYRLFACFLASPLETSRLEMNVGQPPSVRNYTKLGFAKARLAPVAWDMLSKFWNIATEDGDMGVTEWPKYPGSYVVRCACGLVIHAVVDNSFLPIVVFIPYIDCFVH